MSEHEIGMSKIQESYETEPQRPMTVFEGSLAGGMGGIVALAMCQVIEPLPYSFISNPTATTEGELVGGVLVIGTLIGGGIAYAARRLRERRQEMQQQAEIQAHQEEITQYQAVMTEHVDAIATPEFVKKGVLEFYIHLSKQSHSTEAVNDSNSR